MSQFRKGSEGYVDPNSGGTKREQVNHILREDSGCTFVDYYLPEKGNKHQFRIVNSFDPETGQEDAALNPKYVFEDDPEAQKPYPIQAPPTVVGQWARGIEMLRQVGDKRASLITHTHICDEDGEHLGHRCRDGSVINENWSVARVFIFNLQKKIKEAEEEITVHGPHGAHLVQSVPQQWIPWVGRWKDGYWQSWWKVNTSFPFEAILVQCRFKMIASNPIIDSASGHPTWLDRAVLMLPKEVVPEFFPNLKTRYRTTEPLTPENSQIGDPMTWAGGYLSEIEKVSRGSGSGPMSVKYRMGPVRDDRDPDRKIVREPLDPALAQQLWVPWENILKKPVVEDVIEHLADTFTWQAVAFALRGTTYQDLVPEQHLESARAILPVGASPPVAVQAPPPVAVQAPPPVAVQAPPPAPPAPPQGAFRPPQTATGFDLANAGAAGGSLSTDMPGLPAEAPPPGGGSDARINLPPGVAGSKDLMDRYRAGLSELAEDE
jgi:hypothetical protein